MSSDALVECVDAKVTAPPPEKEEGKTSQLPLGQPADIELH